MNGPQSMKTKIWKLNLNDIKNFIVLYAKYWWIKHDCLKKAKVELPCKNTNKKKGAIIGFLGFEIITLDKISNDFSDILIAVTDWTCVSWYSVCMILENAVFCYIGNLFYCLTTMNYPFGKFACDIWLFTIKGWIWNSSWMINFRGSEFCEYLVSEWWNSCHNVKTFPSHFVGWLFHGCAIM